MTIECKYKNKCSVKDLPSNTCPIGEWFLNTIRKYYTDEEYEECIELCKSDSWEDQYEHVWAYIIKTKNQENR